MSCIRSDYEADKFFAPFCLVSFRRWPMSQRMQRDATIEERNAERGHARALAVVARSRAYGVNSPLQVGCCKTFLQYMAPI